MDFKKTGATAIAVGFVGGAFLLGGVILGSSSSDASTQMSAPKTQTPHVTVTVSPGGLTPAPVGPSTEDGGNNGGSLVPVNQPTANGGGENQLRSSPSSLLLSCLSPSSPRSSSRTRSRNRRRSSRRSNPSLKPRIKAMCCNWPRRP